MAVLLTERGLHRRRRPRLAAAISALLVAASACGGGSDETRRTVGAPNQGITVEQERAEQATELPFPGPHDGLRAITARDGTLAVGSVSGGQVVTTTSTDDGATWDTQTLPTAEAALGVAMSAGDGGLLMAIVLCPSVDVNFEDGCQPGRATLAMLGLEGDRWIESSRTAIPDLAPSEATIQLVSGGPGSLAVYSAEQADLSQAVIFDAAGQTVAKAEIKGVVDVICRPLKASPSGPSTSQVAARWRSTMNPGRRPLAGRRPPLRTSSTSTGPGPSRS